MTLPTPRCSRAESISRACAPSTPLADAARRRASSRRLPRLGTSWQMTHAPIGRSKLALDIREVYSTIAELPDDFRLALVAIDVLGLSHREASRALKVPEATLTTRLSHAHSHLSSRLPDPASNQAA